MPEKGRVEQWRSFPSTILSLGLSLILPRVDGWRVLCVPKDGIRTRYQQPITAIPASIAIATVIATAVVIVTREKRFGMVRNILEHM